MATAVCSVCRVRDVHGTNWCPSCSNSEEQGLCRSCDGRVSGSWLALHGLCRGCALGEWRTWDGELYHTSPSPPSDERHLWCRHEPEAEPHDEPEAEPPCASDIPEW